MQLQTAKFTAKDAGFFGVGLSVVGARKWLDASRDGALLAHDLLEHVNGIEAIGTVHDELTALGAYWYVRGQHGQVNGEDRTIDPIEPLSREVARQIGLCTPYGARFSKAAVWRAVSDAEREAPGPWDQALCRVANSAPGFSPVSKAFVTQRADDALHYMRRGARLASEKYGDAFGVNRLFWKISHALQPHANGASMGEEFEMAYSLESVVVRRTREAKPILRYTAFYGDATTVDSDLVASMAKLKEVMSAARVWKKTGTMSGGTAVQLQNMPRIEATAKTYSAKVHGPKHAQRNVYKEARA